MDLTEIIRTLYVEKAKVENSIAALEALESNSADGLRTARRRGRKSMGTQERQQVSERMKKYWASWRESAASAAGAGSD
ncbi:MAG TPA: hypothetical protein VKT49_11255 [Bryobacteraceae bacterium]|nr:hypothetical protein [Bryobacteraceae bacterium]